MKKKQEIRKLIKGKRREELKQAGAQCNEHKDILDDED